MPSKISHGKGGEQYLANAIYAFRPDCSQHREDFGSVLIEDKLFVQFRGK